MFIVKLISMFATVGFTYATRKYNDTMSWYETVNYLYSYVLPMAVFC